MFNLAAAGMSVGVNVNNEAPVMQSVLQFMQIT